MKKSMVRRVGARDPYVEYALRCQYAVETFESINRPAAAQVIELEFLLLDDEGEEQESPGQ